MIKNYIENANFEDTGFAYTLSLISGKHKMVICLLSLVSVRNVLRYWSNVFMQKIRRSFLLKLLIVIIRWRKIFLRIAVRKPNFVLLPILRVKENI